jgi:hypothetical protein
MEGTTPTYQLQKRRPGGAPAGWGTPGMYWRCDQYSHAKTKGGHVMENWPRDGALLKGTVIETKQGNKWLRVTHICQPKNATGAWHRNLRERLWTRNRARSEGGVWVKAPEGAYIPFEHKNLYRLEQVLESQERRESERKS